MNTRSEMSFRLRIRFLAVTAALLVCAGPVDAQTERVQRGAPTEGIGEETPAELALVAVPQCPSLVILAGVDDNFSQANGAEPSAPSSTLQATVGAPLTGFDGTLINRRLLHTFRLPPCKCLVGAKLEFRAKALGNCGSASSSNDSISLGFSTLGFPSWSARLGGPNSPPALSTPCWGGPPLVRNFSLDLAALGNGVSLLPGMQTNKYLDVYVQDDTSIDYLKLTATMCDCCQPAGRAEICISKFQDTNGDGVKGPAEPGLPGWQFQANDQAGGNLVLSPPTTAGGGICFGVLAPATYTISEVPKAGWSQTTPKIPPNPVVTVVPGGPAVNLVFGNRKLVPSEPSVQPDPLGRPQPPEG